MAEVRLVNVKKIYPFVSGEEKKKHKKKKDDEPVKEKANLQITDKGVVAVQEFNLDIADKEFIVLVGPSGCGKSTTLRMIAGLEEITEGELYIDGRVCRLCFHVADEAAHAALAAKSKCCLLYAKLTRRAAGAARTVCAVVTAGSTAGLYVGRNGVFYDCDGQDWDAVVTRVVEAQVSLREAFWSPWAKIAATVAAQCRKFLSSCQTTAADKVGDAAAPAPFDGGMYAPKAEEIPAPFEAPRRHRRSDRRQGK